MVALDRIFTPQAAVKADPQQVVEGIVHIQRIAFIAGGDLPGLNSRMTCRQQLAAISPKGLRLRVVRDKVEHPAQMGDRLLLAVEII